MNTFPDSHVPIKSTVCRLVNSFRDTGTIHRLASDTRKRVTACIAGRGGNLQQVI
jgi:hypothetical protein